jgi:hypothetical protein
MGKSTQPAHLRVDIDRLRVVKFLINHQAPVEPPLAAPLVLLCWLVEDPRHRGSYLLTAEGASIVALEPEDIPLLHGPTSSGPGTKSRSLAAAYTQMVSCSRARC